MVEIKYGENYEVANLAGQSVAEAREQFKAEFGISGKARARINDKKIKEKMESEVRLADNDKLAFSEAKVGKGAFLVGALLLALSVTGGVFAYGLTTDSHAFTTVTSVGSDFAIVTANASVPPDWVTRGKFQGTLGTANATLFDVNTEFGAYPGKTVVTVSIANGDELVNHYRVLAMFLEVYNNAGAKVDINDSGGSGNAADFALLTLANGQVDLYLPANALGDYYTIRLAQGFYNSHISAGWTSGFQMPLLYAEVAQR